MDFDFALVDQTLLVRVDKLNRVFHRENMRGPLTVDQVYHRGQRRRLARSGWPRHQHQPALLARQFGQNRRQSQGGKRFDLGRDDAKDRAFAAPAHKEVDAEAGQVGDFNAEV